MENHPAFGCGAWGVAWVPWLLGGASGTRAGARGFPRGVCESRPQPGTVVGLDNGELPPTHPFADFGVRKGAYAEVYRVCPSHRELTMAGAVVALPPWCRRNPVHFSPNCRVAQMCSVFLSGLFGVWDWLDLVSLRKIP